MKIGPIGYKGYEAMRKRRVKFAGLKRPTKVICEEVKMGVGERAWEDWGNHTSFLDMPSFRCQVDIPVKTTRRQLNMSLAVSGWSYKLKKLRL